MTAQFFKQCKVCQTQWVTRDQFMQDPGIVLIGYQANFIALENGLFLFNHSCQGTLSIEVQAFSDLYVGPIYQERLFKTETCSGYCLYRNELRPCPAKCECTYVREIMRLLKHSEQVDRVAV